MNRASSAQARQALEAANAYVKAGIPFVPVPVLNDEQRDEAAQLALQRLEQIEKEAEQ